MTILAIVRGKLIEMGMLSEGRGIKLEVEGEEVVITGLTVEECQAIAPSFGQRMTVLIQTDELAPTSNSCASEK